MLKSQKNRLRLSTLFASAVALTTVPGSALARPAVTTEETLLDRIQIEELLIDYYAGFGTDENDGFGEYYLEDGVFLLNGISYKGRNAIKKIYDDLGETTNFSDGAFRMLLTNLRITVDGDEATASMIWTGIMNNEPKSLPKLVEQGRELDKLEKRDGVWYFKERVVIADSGLPDMFDESYENATPAKE